MLKYRSFSPFCGFERMVKETGNRVAVSEWGSWISYCDTLIVYDFVARHMSVHITSNGRFEYKFMNINSQSLSCR